MRYRNVGVAFLLTALAATGGSAQVTRYVRFADSGRGAWGVVEGEAIHVLAAPPWAGGTPTGRRVEAGAVTLLAPVEPGKVIAVGLNYRSHLGDRPTPTEPGLFAKFPTSIIGPDAEIVLPPGAGNVHFEGELVVVIGRRAWRVPVEAAAGYVFGVTAGNDVSERDWQRDDLQWFRAKGSDTFGPVGPAVVTGLDYGNLQLTTRLNGAVMQSQRTSDLLFGVAEIVSYVSRFVTLEPGDVIFTGTPGSTRAMRAGDVVEVEIEGVGILRNTVIAP